MGQNDDHIGQEDEDPSRTLDAGKPLYEVGSHIGGYKLLSILGEGGFGMVYLAEQQHPLKRLVALKVIKPGMDTKQVIARFETERQALAMLDHPHIASVFDAGATDTGRPYFAMEYVKGVAITEYCDRSRLNTQARLRLFIPLCQAIQHAHHKGIIHRDLKPSNVLVMLHEEKPVPKIIDFGVAKALNQRLTERTLVTEKGDLLGTPEYMSPEQAEVTGLDVDTRTDIYSLGVLLYELLTGCTPFDPEDLRSKGYAEMQRIICEQDPVKPSTKLTTLGGKLETIARQRRATAEQLRNSVRGDLDWIVMKALEKDRTRRYETANGLAQDIERHLNNEPVMARPPSELYRFQKLVRRNKGVFAGCAAVAAALVIGLTVSAVSLVREQHTRRLAVAAQEQEAAARARAEQAEQAEHQQRTLAEQRAEELRRSLYGNSIQLAGATYREGSIRRVRELLESCPNDLRGWEWRRLRHILDQSAMTLRGSKGEVSSLAVTPDGKWIVSGSEREIGVWDLGTGAKRKVLTGHTGMVNSLALGPEGKRIVSGGRDGTIRVWDAQTGAEVRTLRGAGSVSSVAISPDGQRIVSTITHDIRLDDNRIVSADDNATVSVWDIETGERQKILETQGYRAVFSPDGKRIAVGSADTSIGVCDSISGREVIALRGHRYLVTSLSFSPDGARLVSGGPDAIKVWDVATGVEIGTLRQGYDARTESVACSSDGRLIASGITPDSIRVWEGTVGGEVKDFRGHDGSVLSLAFTPDGRQIVSGGSDGTIKVWDVTIGHDVTKLIGHRGLVHAIAFSPDSRRIASSGRDDHTVKVWDVATGADVMTLRGHRDSVPSVVFSLDGKRLVSGSLDKTIKIWDAETGAEVLTIPAEGYVSAVAMSPDGRRIVAGCVGSITTWDAERPGKIKIWEAQTGTELVALQGQELKEVGGLAFSPDGTRIVGGADDRVRVWDSVSGTELMTLDAHSYRVASVAFSPEGERIVAGDADGMVRVWNASTGAEIRALRGYDSYNTSVAFSPDGERILSGGSDGAIKIWDAANGAELLSIASRSGGCNAVAFSPDGKTIAAAGNESVTLWESGPPAGGYGPRRAAKAAWLARTTEAQAAQRLIDECLAALSLPSQDSNVYRTVLEKAERVVRMEPNQPAIQIPYSFLLEVLGRAQYRAGRYEEAIRTEAEFHRLEPGGDPILVMLAGEQCQAGEYEEALKTLSKGLEISRHIPGAQDWFTAWVLKELAWVRARCPVAELRNGAEAVRNATRACELTRWQVPWFLETLAAACAEAGDFDAAVKWQKEAIDRLPPSELARWQTSYEARLRLYESSKSDRMGNLRSLSADEKDGVQHLPSTTDHTPDPINEPSPALPQSAKASQDGGPAVRFGPDGTIPHAEAQGTTRFSEDLAVYLGCGEVDGPGTVVQVDRTGKALGIVKLPGTPYGLAVRKDGLVAAIPGRYTRPGKVVRIDQKGKVETLFEDEQALPAPIAIAADPSSGAILVADNRTDVLLLLPSGRAEGARKIIQIKGHEDHLQDMSVAFVQDGHLLFGGSGPEGVYYFDAEKAADMGLPILPDRKATVAADPSSRRWAAALHWELRVFEGRQELLKIPYPPGRSMWLDTAAFGPDGILVLALYSEELGYLPGRYEYEVFLVDPKAKTFNLLFSWDWSRVVSLAVGRKTTWKE